MVNGKRTGKCKQFYEEGSCFDGYMLDDKLVQGNFYFANGDFFQGTFDQNDLKSGTYIRADEKLIVEGATFLDGELTGTP